MPQRPGKKECRAACHPAKQKKTRRDKYRIQSGKGQFKNFVSRLPLHSPFTIFAKNSV